LSSLSGAFRPLWQMHLFMHKIILPGETYRKFAFSLQ
jgi:hypothetical protein